MTGPEHYEAAELILAVLDEEMATEENVDTEAFAALLAKAQVHATLALTAATALRTEPVGRTGSQELLAVWLEATGQ